MLWENPVSIYGDALLSYCTCSSATAQIWNGSREKGDGEWRRKEEEPAAESSGRFRGDGVFWRQGFRFLPRRKVEERKQTRLDLDRFTGSSVSSRFGNIKEDSAPEPIKTKPATGVKLPRLSQALNYVLRTAHFLVFMTRLQATEYVAAPPRPSGCISPCPQPPSAAIAEKPAASPVHYRTSKPAPCQDLPGLFQWDWRVLSPSGEELIEDIKLVRDERKQLEWTRQELLRKGKDLLSQNRHRRNQGQRRMRNFPEFCSQTV